MGRYRGAACKQCRREGMKLFLKGARCSMAKCPIETGRGAPGMHGQRRRKKLSDYGVQLRTKQRLRRHYGLQERQFRLCVERAVRRPGVTGELLLQQLESRLDNVVYRMGFALSRRAARQFVGHNHVLVNGARADIPAMVLAAGAVVSVRNRPNSRELARKSLEMNEGRTMPPWLSVDARNFSGAFVRIPTRDEIAPIVDERLVIELYSK